MRQKSGFGQEKDALPAAWGGVAAGAANDKTGVPKGAPVVNWHGLAAVGRGSAVQPLTPLACKAARAVVTSSLNAAASVAARSAMTLRSSATLAAFKPSMKRA